MFNNLINKHDILNLVNKIGQDFWKKLFSKINGSTKKHWESVYERMEFPPVNWWDIPAVRERWNFLVSGDAKIDYVEYVSRKFLHGREALNVLSLGCGYGHKVMKWAELGKFDRIDAFDLSNKSIEYAESQAKKKGYNAIIRYRVADIYREEYLKDFYDIVLVEHSLHHFSPLNIILNKIREALKPDGYFIVDEFVGPTRFQWTKKQLYMVNALLSILPTHKKLEWDGVSAKTEVYSPSRLSMILSDPSEAVESSNIMPLLSETFNVIETKGYGGNVLHLLFNGIAHNFLSDDKNNLHILRCLFEIEDLFLSGEDVQSDFILSVCRKKD